MNLKSGQEQMAKFYLDLLSVVKTNRTIIFRYRDIIYIIVILLLLLFRSSHKTQEKNIIQSEKKIDSIEKEIIKTKSNIKKYEEVKIDFVDTFQRNDIEKFLSKRYDNKNTN